MRSQGLLSSAFIKLLSAIHVAGGVPCEKYPDVFYPEDYPNPEDRHLATRTAKAICHTCPIIDKCFEYALETNQTHGIWGGTSPAER